MAINRRHLIAPLAIGAAALSLAGTGAAFAATGTHTAAPAARHTAAVVLKADRPDRDATKDVAGKDTAKDTSQGTTRDVPSRDTTHDAARTDRAATNDR
jgi:hypothetical protein